MVCCLEEETAGGGGVVPGLGVQLASLGVMRQESLELKNSLTAMKKCLECGFEVVRGNVW